MSTSIYTYQHSAVVMASLYLLSTSTAISET